MSAVELHFASGGYDRVQPLLDGRVTIPGVRFRHVALTPEELFPRALQNKEFDIFEMSLSGFVRRIARGQNDLVGLPIFISRAFRHSAIYIRTDRGIVEPQDLKGKVVGVPDYAMTGAVWVRGFLHEDYSVAPADMVWRTGGLHRAGHSTSGPSDHPGLDIAPIPQDRTLSELLASGGIDALISSATPEAFSTRCPGVGRLFADYREVEQAYFERTRLFPIMHLIVVRRSVLAQYGDLRPQLLRAFQDAKMLAIRDLSELSSLHTTLPWPTPEVDRTIALMGNDYWPYGVEPNQHALDAFVSFARQQNLIPDHLGAAHLGLETSGAEVRFVPKVDIAPRPV